MGKAVICLTTAPPGAGKTYVRFARFVFDTWLPECGPGVHWSNFPVRFDSWEDDQGNKGDGLVKLASRRYKLSPDEVRERVQQIPPEVIDTWRDNGRLEGPWTFFRDIDLNGAHIAIDEAHAFFPSKGRPKHAAALSEWLAEIRHRGATVEFITQHPGQVARELVRSCGEKLVLTNLENETEPLFNIRVGDWLELVAGLFTRRYVSYVRQERMIQWGMGWKISESGLFSLDPWYFSLYDSYSSPVAAGGHGAMGRLPPWKQYGRLRLLWWFYSRNFFGLSWRGAVLAAFAWVALFGGQKVLVKGFQSGIENIIATATPAGITSQSDSTNDPIRRGEPVKAIVEKLDVVESVAQLAKFTGLQMECDRLRENLAQVQARLGEFGGLVMITGQDQIRFESGDTYKVGETIDYGPYKNCKVARIDWIRRAVVLSDGRLVRLGFDRDDKRLSSSSSESRDTGVSTPLRGFGESGSETNAGQSREGSKLQRPRYSGWRSDPVVDGRNGGIDRRSRGSRRSPRGGGDPLPEFDGSFGRDSGKAGGDVRSTRPTLLPRTEPPG